MHSSTDLAIEAVGLTKRFGDTTVVDHLDLAVPAGSVYGFLGPNGAGKTTTVRMLATLLRPDGGVAHVLGHDLLHEADAIRERISLTGQFASVDDDLTGLENLILLSRLLGFGRRDARLRAAELLSGFDLDAAANRQVKTYSGGMRRRLDIAASLIVTPELLFLDEPTTGLDPRSRNQVWQIVRATVALGTTVLLTTQDLTEADHLADRIGVIDHGKLIAEGTSGELKASLGAGAVRIRLRDPEQRPAAEATLTRLLHVPVHLDAEPVSLRAQIPAGDDTRDSAEHAARVLSQLSRDGIAVADFALGQPSLDEVFLNLTGHVASTELATQEYVS